MLINYKLSLKDTTCNMTLLTCNLICIWRKASLTIAYRPRAYHIIEYLEKLGGKFINIYFCFSLSFKYLPSQVTPSVLVQTNRFIPLLTQALTTLTVPL